MFLARAIVIPVSKQLGQAVVVENKPAPAPRSRAISAQSPPDGYTLWLQDITHARDQQNTLYRSCRTTR